MVIPNGLTEETLAASSSASTWNGEPHLLAVTSDEPHKDNATLIRTLAELARRRGEIPWTLSLAATGPLERERRLAADLGVGDRIRWLGFVSAMRLRAFIRSRSWLRGSSQ